MLDAGVLVEAALVTRERHGQRSMRRNAEDRAGIRVETARKIQRHEGSSRPVHRGNRIGEAARDRTVETRPEEPIDDERRVREVLTNRGGALRRNFHRVYAQLIEQRPVGLRVTA